jgi:hypothetical protein
MIVLPECQAIMRGRVRDETVGSDCIFTWTNLATLFELFDLQQSRVWLNEHVNYTAKILKKKPLLSSTSISPLQ